MKIKKFNDFNILNEVNYNDLIRNDPNSDDISYTKKDISRIEKQKEKINNRELSNSKVLNLIRFKLTDKGVADSNIQIDDYLTEEAFNIYISKNYPFVKTGKITVNLKDGKYYDERMLSTANYCKKYKKGNLKDIYTLTQDNINYGKI